jgi:hypothetical protein
VLVRHPNKPTNKVEINGSTRDEIKKAQSTEWKPFLDVRETLAVARQLNKGEKERKQQQGHDQNQDQTKYLFLSTTISSSHPKTKRNKEGFHRHISLGDTIFNGQSWYVSVSYLFADNLVLKQKMGLSKERRICVNPLRYVK